MINCPICSSSLKEIDVAPCFDCGHAPHELEEHVRGAHQYYVFSLWGREIVLCDFCAADFDSYSPDYWGLTDEVVNGYPLKLQRKLDNSGVERDAFCSSCGHRVAFLLLRAYAMTQNAT
jgi:hypothetical protein